MSDDLVSLASLSDAELMARLVMGDEVALGGLYDRHATVVFGAVVRFLGDRQAAEEVVQDAFVTIWRQAARFDATAGTVAGWLLRIARNRAIDRLRAAARRPALLNLGGPGGRDEEEAARSVAGLPDLAPIDGPEEAVTRQWSRSVVRAALSGMPEGERRALELAYDEELSQTEIAERLGWPLGTVKSRTRRALATLRTALEGVPGLIDGDDAELRLVPVMRPRAGEIAGGTDAAR